MVLWEYLDKVDRKILNYLVQICQSFAQRNLEEILLNEIHNKLIKIVTLIESEYGRKMITSNLHLSLHLIECSSDFSLLYAFWYFSFERMNGMLGKRNWLNLVYFYFFLLLFLHIFLLRFFSLFLHLFSYFFFLPIRFVTE